MEEKNELSDILLEQKGPNKATKIKRLIVIAVLLVLLFVLVLMIMKLISKPEDTSGTLTDSLLSQTPPQTVIETPEVNTSNFYDTPNDSAVNANDTFNDTIDSGITIIDNDSVNVSPNIAPPATIVTPPKQTSVPKQTTPSQPKTNVSSGTATTSSSSVSSGHYVQVGAFSKAPDKSFLDSITKGGYKYHLYKTTVKSQTMTKVLVGPFKSESEARIQLPEIRDSIAKDAMYSKIQ
ncbi:MAG: SPOR domain-containing protein [Prevotellaceae bacterium]|nr:SPOR domain-containing protein [Prevotellaceae bacterium]